jgi:hypothetical protein
LTNQERDIWKPYYEDAVRAGINTGWAFSTLRFAAEDNPYTRIWFSAMAQFNDTDGHPPPELAKKWESRFRTLSRADELRKVVRDELWRLVDQTAGARWCLPLEGTTCR